jgi:pimeloyl-ACP methyl ester carboxylesterase
MPRFGAALGAAVFAAISLGAASLETASQTAASPTEQSPTEPGVGERSVGASQPLALGTVAQPELSWGDCPSAALSAMQCSTVLVPLDYRDPGGRKIEIAVSRLPSTDPAKRRGVLLVNPGGPGLPGLPMPIVMTFPEQVRESYDVIGFDPRGVGRSTPLTCDLTADLGAVASNPPYPDADADVAAQASAAELIAKQCNASATSDLVPFVTTANTARDMDQIRAALNEPAISYYGQSYGTYLGAVYTTMFPASSDRIVLDSSLPPEGYDVEALRSQSLGFELRFPDFARFAAADPDQYGLGSTPAEVTAKYTELAQRLDQAPAQGYDGTIFRVVTAALLRADSTFPDLATLWHQLDTGQAIPDPGAGEADYNDNFPAAYLAVICGDTQWPQTVEAYQYNVTLDRVRYPMYGPFAANIRPCAFWPAPAEPKVRLSSEGPSNVLIVQNLRDPATPLPDALRTRQAFGERARIVVIDQGGHGAYLPGMNKCGNDTVTAYLAGGQWPAHDVFCPA